MRQNVAYHLKRSTTRAIRRGLLLLLAAFGPHLSAAQALDGSEVDERALPVLGSGFILNRLNHVVTNVHVVLAKKENERIKIQQGGSSVAATVVHPRVYPRSKEDRACHSAVAEESHLRILEHCQPDLAILRMEKEPLGDVEAIELRLSVPERGSDVRAYGFPGASQTVARVASGNRDITGENEIFHSAPGTLYGIRPGIDGTPYLLETNASISSGYSGGPMFDACARLIGVNTLSAVYGAESWAVWAGSLAKLLDDNGIEYRYTEESCSAADGVEVASELEKSDFVSNLEADDGGDMITNVVAAAIVTIVLVLVVFVLPGSKAWRMFTALAAIAVGLLALWFFSDRDRIEQAGDVVGNSGDQSGQLADQTAGSAQDVLSVQRLVVHNKTFDTIVSVKMSLPGMDDWREVANGTIEGGGGYGTLDFSGDDCVFDFHVQFRTETGVNVTDERENFYQQGKYVCDGRPLEYWAHAPFRVVTNPLGGEVTVMRGDGAIVWRPDQGTMPELGKRLRLDYDYVVKAEKKGYDPWERGFTGKPDGWYWPATADHPEEGPGWTWKAYLRCKAGSEERRRFQDDCKNCPEMVVIPAGCMDGVHVGGPFAASKDVVMYEQWKACKWCKKGKGVGKEGRRGSRKDPAINVSLEDARNYVAWLRDVTKKDYRLLSESEWQYATRADKVEPGGRGNKTKGGNEWSLIHGNVHEWVQDCWNEPDPDQAAKACGIVHSDGKKRWNRPWIRDPNVGFRVARECPCP